MESTAEIIEQYKEEEKRLEKRVKKLKNEVSKLKNGKAFYDKSVLLERYESLILEVRATIKHLEDYVK